MGASADVVVIGAGLSGLECAGELVRAGARDVVVVDAAGGDARGAASWRSTRPPHYERVTQPDRVGGRSLRWHGVVVRLEDWALEDPSWPRSVRAALRDGDDSLYEEVERDLTEWAGGSLLDETQDGRLPDVVSAALGTTGGAVPKAARRDAGGVHAYTPLDRCRDWSGPSGGRPAILAGHGALGLVVRGGRVTGVRVYAGDAEVISAGNVVLAAGTLENARLVAQLGGVDAGGGGFAGLNDHLVQGFVVRLSAAALGWHSPTDVSRYALGDAKSRSNVFARVRPASEVDGDGGDVLLDVWAMGEQLPSDHTVVRFQPAEDAPWTGTIAPGLAPADREVLAGQREALGRFWAEVSSGVRGRPDPPVFGDLLLEPRPFHRASEQVTACAAGAPVPYAWPLGSVDHESGLLALGGAHVEEDGRLRTVDGAHVVGPGTFPRSGAANPSLTTLALARRTARVLAAGG